MHLPLHPLLPQMLVSLLITCIAAFHKPVASQPYKAVLITRMPAAFTLACGVPILAGYPPAVPAWSWILILVSKIVLPQTIAMTWVFCATTILGYIPIRYQPVLPKLIPMKFTV